MACRISRSAKEGEVVTAAVVDTTEVVDEHTTCPGMYIDRCTVLLLLEFVLSDRASANILDRHIR